MMKNPFFLTRTGIFAEYGLLALCGGVFALAFPGKNFAFLGWIGVIPLILAAFRSRGAGAFFRGFVWGWFWSLAAFAWLREIETPIPFVLAFVLAPFSAVWCCWTSWLWRNSAHSPAARLEGASRIAGETPFSGNVAGSLIFLAGASGFWCVLEWVRSWILTGLPWNFLAATQWRNVPLIQICEITGMYGVSFLVIAVNLAFAMALPWILSIVRGRKYSRPWPLVIMAVVLAFVSYGGMYLLKVRSEALSGAEKVGIGLVQCDLSQRRFADREHTLEALDVCLDLSRKLLEKDAGAVGVSLDGKGGGNPPLSLIVWPETAIPVPYRGNSEISELYREGVGGLLEKYKVPFLVGSLDFEPDSNGGYDLSNSVLLLREPGGKIADRYSKTHLVPFGEYVPLGRLFPGINKALGMGRDLRPGKVFHPIAAAPGVRAGVSVCYESVFPHVSRGHALAGANLLIVVSNDAWYPVSDEPEQHFANALFRAVETRLPLLRSGNSSHTLLIDPTGIVRAVALGGLDDRGRAAVKFSVPVPENPRTTFYTRYGNVFVAFCALLAFFAAVPAFLNWRTFRLAQLTPPDQKES